MTRVRRIETFLSPQDAIRLTGLSDRTLRRCLRHGRLTAYRTTGGHRRFARSELLALSVKRQIRT